MWTMPVPSSSETSSHGITRWTTPSCAGKWSNGPLVLQPDELRAALALLEMLLRIAVDRDPLADVVPRPYSASGLTAAATFAGSVHGVVVQTTSDSPSRPRNGKRTKSDGCSSSS